MQRSSNSIFIAAALLMLAGFARAELHSETSDMPVATLAVPASKHWVWVNDLVFPHMADGMAHLVDGDTGRYLGTLSTGYSFSRVLLSRDGKIVYAPETYFSRGTRGQRTDIVTLYDAGTLNPIGEIAIPPKRASDQSVMANAEMTDDDRFLLIYNFTPAQSVTVVDTISRKFVGEVETPGCALVYPTGPRTFFSICGDSALMLVSLDDAGAATQIRTDPVLPTDDKVREMPVRIGKLWYFVSIDGRIYSLEANGQRASVHESWWLTSVAERKSGWRPGGLQQLAVDPNNSHLYAIMHQGGIETHKAPGKDVWAFDINSHRRIQALRLKSPAGSIKISSDAHPLMFATNVDSTNLDIYDVASGHWLRRVRELGTSPTIMVTP